MTTGDRIYYTGDMANHDGYGHIEQIHPPDRWGGESYKIVMDDGRVFDGTYPTSFSAGPGRRFWLASDWQAHREAEIERMRASILAMRNRRAS